MNLRQVRKKTKSIRNVRKITKAMQLVSAVKMKKAQAREIEGRPYRVALSSVLDKLMVGIEEKSSVLLTISGENAKKDLVILVSSNKGLCGSFNVNLYRFLVKNGIDFDSTDFITVGTKGAQFLGRMKANVVADFSEGRFLDQVSAIFSFALENFLAGKHQNVSIVYNRYISTFDSEPTQETLLPLRKEISADQKQILKVNYKIEPSPDEILEPLIKSYLEDRIRAAITSSEAVEHASRMVAMKNATDNATDIIFNLTLISNKLRQEKITNELLDMITAKESVEQ